MLTIENRGKFVRVLGKSTILPGLNKVTPTEVKTIKELAKTNDVVAHIVEHDFEMPDVDDELDVTGMTVTQLKKTVAETSDLSLLDEMLSQEQGADKPRDSAIASITERIDQVKGN